MHYTNLASTAVEQNLSLSQKGNLAFRGSLALPRKSQALQLLKKLQSFVVPSFECVL